MRVNRWWAMGVLAVILMGVAPALAVNIEMVPVGNAWNSDDLHGDGYGGVGYEYNIGKYEVTVGQYTEFLNAVAADDTYGLYSANMWSSDYGGQISRNGPPAGYVYSAAADWADRPVGFVSWGDAARFSNWLHNGQPVGGQDLSTTEDGSYYLNGATTGTALMAVTRKAGATWAIPTEDEWYKAAYHKSDGVTANYFDYPTGSDIMPSGDLVDPDPGNNATFYRYGYTIGSPYYRTEVGAHENSESPYGTFDQGGNVEEWTEGEVGSRRILRGGAYNGSSVYVYAGNRVDRFPTYEYASQGFRVVPEPATLALLAFGGVGLLVRRKALGG